MKRAGVISICVALAAFSAACGRHDEQAGKKNIVDLATHPPKFPEAVKPVVVTGCLTGTPEHFVLTKLDTSVPESITYELVNANDQLLPLVGQKVRITGEAEPVQTAEALELTVPDPATAATSGKTPAKVTTVEDTKLRVERLTVTSVAGTGDTCTR
jgi:hypothetical protein